MTTISATIAVAALERVRGGAQTFNERWNEMRNDIRESTPYELYNRRYRQRFEQGLTREGLRRLNERKPDQAIDVTAPVE